MNLSPRCYYDSDGGLESCNETCVEVCARQGMARLKGMADTPRSVRVKSRPAPRHLNSHSAQAEQSYLWLS